MNTSIASPAPATGQGSVLFFISVVLALWGGLVLTLAANGLMMVLPGRPPTPILIAIAVPVTAFAALYSSVPAVRDFALSLDLRLITAFQAWRILGGVFLALYAFDVLPGFFASLAGGGDVAVGLAAPFIVLALARDANYAASRRFVLFNLAGLFDFVVALGSGSLTALIGGGLAGTASMAPVNVLPLVMIPGFLVPIFIILHLVALAQSHQARKEARKEAGK